MEQSGSGWAKRNSSCMRQSPWNKGKPVHFEFDEIARKCTTKDAFVVEVFESVFCFCLVQHDERTIGHVGVSPCWEVPPCPTLQTRHWHFRNDSVLTRWTCRAQVTGSREEQVGTEGSTLDQFSSYQRLIAEYHVHHTSPYQSGRPTDQPSCFERLSYEY